MLIKSFFNIIIWCGISLALCLVGFLISYFYQGPIIAKELFNSWIFYFDGILVGGVGYGLVWFIRKYGSSLLAQINEVITISEEDLPKIFVYSRRMNSTLWKNTIGIPLTIVGGIIMWNCGYPMEGFAKYYLAISSISIYYIGSYLLTFFIFSLLMFKSLEDSEKRLEVTRNIVPLEFENLNYFFVITSTIGVAGIYLGFRGTLTANFILDPDGIITRKLLIFPVILFLPLTLCYSFYPRYVLKKIYENDIIKKVKEIEEKRRNIPNELISLKDKIEIDMTLSEIREKLIMERDQFPLISLKDSPSLLISIIMVIQFIAQYDTAINEFFKIFSK
ncbi:MAG: hypothetical protein HZB59_06810 [Ignavibacteriales bacterium]|nr:hypothetical protein [Ignavibacteriales bacterium]